MRQHWVGVGLLVAAATGCQPESSTGPKDTGPIPSLLESGKPRPTRSGVVALRAQRRAGSAITARRSGAQEQDRGNVGPNVVTNQDETTQPQNETVIAVDPRSSGRLVASSNDYRFSDVADSRCGAYASSDGGRTWRDLGDGTLPTPLPAAGDPSVAFAPNGDAYWACLAFSRETDASAIYVAKSSNLRSLRTFAPLVHTTDGSEVFHDKPFMAIDGGGSRFRGRIYVTWTRFSAEGSPIYISSSSNGGATWTTPRSVTPPDLPDNHGSSPGVAPDGTLYVAYENFDTPTINLNQIMVSKSTDGGRTFSRPVKVDAVFDICPQIAFGSCSLLNTSFRVNSFPSLAVSPRNGQVYVTWGDYRSGNADVLASSSADGARWSRPARVNDDRTTTDQFFPAVAATPDGDVTIAYYDRRQDPANHDMDTYLSVSGGSRLSFGKAVRVSSASQNPDEDFGGFFIGDYIGNTASLSVIHPIWSDTRGLNSPVPNQDAVTARVSQSSDLAGR